MRANNAFRKEINGWDNYSTDENRKYLKNKKQKERTYLLIPNMEDNLLHKQEKKGRQQIFPPNIIIQP